VPNTGGHHCPEEHAIDIALHRAAFVTDQLDSLSLFREEPAAAAV